MFKHFFILSSIFLMFAVSAQDMRSPELKTIDELIAQSKLTEAMAAIEKGLKGSPTDLMHLARKSRVQTLMGDKENNEEKKVALYDQAQATANIAIEKHPKAAQGYNRRAIAKGKLILFKGILESRSLVLELRQDAKKVLEMSGVDDYNKALANYLLGRAHLKLASKPRALRMPLGLAWASNKKGGEFLKKATKLSPNTISFNLSYAQWLIDQDQSSKAKPILEKIDSLDVYDPADIDAKQTAKKLLGSL